MFLDSDIEVNSNLSKTSILQTLATKSDYAVVKSAFKTSKAKKKAFACLLRQQLLNCTNCNCALIPLFLVQKEFIWPKKQEVKVIINVIQNIFLKQICKLHNTIN